MRLAPFVILAPLLGHSASVLDQRTSVVVDEVGLTREVRAEQDGSLHVFARSNDVSPQLTVVLGRGEPAGDAGALGGRSAYVRLDVAAGDRAAIELRAAEGESGEVLLAWALAAETDERVRAVDDARAEIQAIEALRQNGDLETARARVTALADTLVSLDDGSVNELLADVLYACGRTAESLSLLAVSEHLFAACLTARERFLPPEHDDVLLACTRLAIAKAIAGNLRGALPLFERNYEGRKRSLPPGDVNVPIAANNVASALRHLDRLDEAVAIYEESYAAISAARDEEDEHVLRARLSLGTGYYETGDAARARPLVESAYEGFRALLGEDHRDFKVAQQTLSVVLAAVGDLIGAADLLEDLLAWRRANLPADHPDLIEAMTNLRAMRVRLGDVEGALRLAEATLEAHLRTQPAGHRDVLFARWSLANNLRLAGELERARVMDEELVADALAMLPEDHPDVLQMKVQLALSLNESGDPRGALEIEREVLAAYERILPESHRTRQVATTNVGSTLMDLGRYAEALPFLERVREQRRVLSVGHEDRLGADTNVLAACTGVNERERARRALDDVLEGLAARADQLRTLSPRLARADARRQLTRVAGAIAARRVTGPGFEPRMFEALEALRYVSTVSAELAWSAEHDPELALLRDRLGAARRALQDESLRGAGEGEEEGAWETRLTELAHGRDRADRELRKALAAQGFDVEPPSLAALSRALGERAAFASFFRVAGEQLLGAEDEAPEKQSDRLVAFVVTRGDDLRLHDLGPADEVEALVARWRGAIGTPLLARGARDQASRGLGLGSEKESAREQLDAGRELRERVLDPLEAGAIERLHVVLDDSLHLVPLDALPRDDGSLVGDGLHVHVEISTRRLVSTERPHSDGTLLALGGVDYGAAGASLAENGLRSSRASRALPTATFQPLAFTVPEVETIAALYEASEEAAPTVLTGAKATKAALAEAAEGARFLHVATHGWFADADQVTGEATAARALRNLAPETLCGLALTGANGAPGGAGRVAGLMTAEELGALDLANCELAVLSACETNVGLHAAGQGIQSLKSALHAAGARTAVTSLWRVDDAATRRLMELFYRGLWEDGLGKAEALWTAKRQLAEEGHPTRDWAGWVLTGDPD